jgi:6-phosphogluconolactonase
MIEIYPNSAALAATAARTVAARLAEGLTLRGQASLVATGGRSPGPVYDRLRRTPLDWARVVTTLSDERFVPPQSADSNEHLVRERLLQDEAAQAAFVGLWSGAATAEAAAQAAEPAVRALAPFDVLLLGMGEDGHIASLLPGSPVFAQAMDLACPYYVLGASAPVGSPPRPRITLTLKALLDSRAILLLIAGDAKREVIERAQAGADLPVRGVLNQDRVPLRILWSPTHEG